MPRAKSYAVYLEQIRRAFLLRAHPDRFLAHPSNIKHQQSQLIQALTVREKSLLTHQIQNVPIHNICSPRSFFLPLPISIQSTYVRMSGSNNYNRNECLN